MVYKNILKYKNIKVETSTLNNSFGRFAYGWMFAACVEENWYLKSITSSLMTMARADGSQIQVDSIKDIRMIFMWCWNARDGW